MKGGARGTQVNNTNTTPAVGTERLQCFCVQSFLLLLLSWVFALGCFLILFGHVYEVIDVEAHAAHCRIANTATVGLQTQ